MDTSSSSVSDIFKSGRPKGPVWEHFTTIITRWNSTFFMIGRLLSVKEHLPTILNTLKWDYLLVSDWDYLEKIAELLKPFHKYTDTMHFENDVTNSQVIPNFV